MTLYMIMTMIVRPLFVVVMGIMEATAVLMAEEAVVIVKFEGGIRKIEWKNANDNAITKFGKFFYIGKPSVNSRSITDVEGFQRRHDIRVEGCKVAIYTDDIT